MAKFKCEHCRQNKRRKMQTEEMPGVQRKQYYDKTGALLL